MEIKKTRGEKTRVALVSAIGAICLVTLKLTVGLMTRSLGILSEAAHSSLDLFASLITFFAVRVSDKPADKEHPYGHGKVESVAAFTETFLLLVTCTWILIEAIKRLLHGGRAVEVNIWAFGVMIISIAIDLSRSTALSRVAKKYGSQALEADALNFKSDILSSLVVIVGLIFTKIGFEIGDSLAAVGVALFVIRASVRLGQKTLHTLTDRAPEGALRQIEKALLNLEKISGYRNLRVRQAGPKLFVDLTVSIDRTVPFEQAHSVTEEIEKQLSALLPDSDVVVHAEPAQSEDEAISDIVKIAARRLGARAHGVRINSLEGRYHVDMDVECDEDLGLRAAHEIASKIEQEIKHDLPEVAEVNIHLEEETEETVEGDDITDVSLSIVKKIENIVGQIPGVLDCHNIRIAKVNDKYHIRLDCSMDDSISLKQAHEIAIQIEDTMRADLENIDKVLIHTEPVSESR